MQLKCLKTLSVMICFLEVLSVMLCNAHDDNN